jgi:hypothetical protein
MARVLSGVVSAQIVNQVALGCGGIRSCVFAVSAASELANTRSASPRKEPREIATGIGAWLWNPYLFAFGADIVGAAPNRVLHRSAGRQARQIEIRPATKPTWTSAPARIRKP